MVERRTKAALTPRARKNRTARPREHGRWFVLRVILLTGRGEELADPPGRDLLIHDGHTFEAIARAIDRSFARWDLRICMSSLSSTDAASRWKTPRSSAR